MLKTKPFINREKEQEFLKKRFANIPNSILWVSGPKSCGKSSLISKVVKELDEKKYAVNFIDLRGVIIYNFQTFLDVFFQPDETLKEKAGKIISGISVNAGFFSVGVNDDVMLKKNAFKVMEDQIFQAKEKWIQPIIIIDEIQMLKDIYLNGERRLIDEVFNLFVRLTKVKHLAHVVCLTSDSYFMEEIFSNANLAKTSTFYHIDHFDQEMTTKWLKSEGLIDEEIKIMWSYFWWSPWDIWEILLAFKWKDDDLTELCERLYKQQEGQLYEFRRLLPKEQVLIFDKVNQDIIKQWFYVTGDEDDELLSKMLKRSVDQDIWFYRAETRKITANSPVIRKAMKNL